MPSTIELVTGTYFDPLNPKIEDIHLDDIAHALYNICRFAGHCERFRSVAAHSLTVGRLAEIACTADEDSEEYQVIKKSLAVFYKGEIPVFTELERKQALVFGYLHDSAEAYLGDIPSPMKARPEFAFYRQKEAELFEMICDRLEAGRPTARVAAIVQWADLFCLQLEARFLMYSGGINWGIVDILGELDDEDAKKFSYMMYTQPTTFKRKVVEALAEMV